MSLITRCPKCNSAFSVVVDQLRLHEGLVRCGACTHVFDGFACLDSELPTLTNKVSPAPPSTSSTPPTPPTSTTSALFTPSTTSSAAAPIVMRGRASLASPDESMPATGGESADATPRIDFDQIVQITHRLAGETLSSGRGVMEDRPEPKLFRDTEQEDKLSVTLEPVIGEARLRDPQIASPGATPPPFMEREEEPGILYTIAWGGGCLLAFLLLSLQVLYVYRNEIGTAIPSMRSPLNLMCARLGCELSYVRQLERITFTASSLQQTDVAGADGTPPRFLLKFSMRNRYDKPQPWPSLLLSLTDAGGTVVVRKMVLPHEYLPRTLIDQPFAAGQELNLELPLVVRGVQVQGFQLEKFFP